MTELQQKNCVPCEGGTEPLNRDEIVQIKKEVSPDWKVLDDKKLHKEFPFENFNKGMSFVNKVAGIADEENHHPDVCISYSQVGINLSTHAIGGLSENDFIMASKIDSVNPKN